MISKTVTSGSHLTKARFEQQELLNRALSGVVSSGVLGKSERRAQLLQYLVDKELSGRGKELKAYSIALDV
jgi:hypothetical protein